MTIARKGLVLIAVLLIAQSVFLITLVAVRQEQPGSESVEADRPAALKLRENAMTAQKADSVREAQARTERLLFLGLLASAIVALGLAILLQTRIIRRLRWLRNNAAPIHENSPSFSIAGDDELIEGGAAVREAGKEVARAKLIRDNTERLSRLNDAQAELMALSPDLPRMLDTIASSARELTGADGAVVEVAEGKEMVSRAAVGSARDNLGIRVPIEGSLSGFCYEANRRVICDDSEKDPRVNLEACRKVGARSLLAVPLNQKARPWGVLKVISSQSSAFGPSVVDTVELLARSFSGALANASMYQIQMMEAEERSAELESLRQRFEIFMDHMPVLAYIKDFDGRYVYVNPAMHSAMSQRGAHEPLGILAEDWMPRDVAEEIQRQDREILESEKPFESKGTTYVELPPSHFMLLRFPIIERDGRRFLGGISVDVSDRIEAENEVRRLNEELEQRVKLRTSELEAANRELEAFAYSVSHDLRTPLRAVKGYARMFDEDFGGTLSPEGARLLGVIRQNAELMGELIDALLRLSRLSRQPLRLTTVDATRLVQEVFGALAEASGGVQPQLDLEPLPAVRADAALLRQVFTNLLANAIKFSALRKEPRIGVSSRAVDGEIVFRVRDNGVGFDMNDADRVFGVFQRLHRHDEFEGTGVGLAIVERIVARHGGRVWAEGARDKGASFHFSIPENRE